jgi:hypothetical protein
VGGNGSTTILTAGMVAVAPQFLSKQKKKKKKKIIQVNMREFPLQNIPREH